MKFLSILIIFLSGTTYAQVNHIDSLALVDIDQSNQNNTLGWDFNTPVNTWEGVTVENNRVTQLQINAKNLYTFEKSFQNLTELEYLHIGGNNLSNFPIEITILTQLNFLHIGNNTISSIPSAFSKLNKLTQVQIQKNNIGYSGIETVDKYFDRSFSYNNQGNISEDSTIFYNQNIIIYVPDSATNNQYQWYKDNSILNNENNRNLSVSEDGTYHCVITNTDYPSQSNITTGKYTMINAGPFLNDSTAIANIHLQNPNNSLSWDLNTPISTWEGVTHSGNPLERITGLVINNKNITILPTSINQLDALEVLQIQENNLTFEEIEKITQTPPASFNYSPQNKIGKSQIIEHSGNPIVISLPADINSSNNSYQWYKDGKVIENDANQNTYTTDQMGTFHCEITNVTLPELTLVSEPTYILNSTIFEQDSLGTVAIYNKNNNNTLQWDINAPITTWQGVQFSNGRINQLKINNAKLDTLPNSIGTLDALDTLWIQNNDLTFQSLDNIATPLPLNFIYQPQNMVGEEKFMDATNGKDVLLEVPSDFDIETTDNHFQWYKDNEIIADANNRQYTTNTTGEYFCQITNDNFPLLTLQTASFNVFDTNQLKADSIIVASIYNDNPSNTLNWDLSTPIETWDGITVSFFRVKTIQLTNKNIQTLPNSIGELEKLDTLVLNENKIDILPESITDLTRLKLLNLSNNNLSSLLDQIGNLSFLNRLEIQNNLIENLPQSIQNLSNIEHINVSNNKLTFEDIILLPNDIQEYFYAPQDSIGENQSYEITREITLTVDQTIDMDVDNILYQWSKNGVIINEENTQNLIVTDKGRYNYIFKKESHSDLILTSKSIYVQFGEGTDPLDSLALADLNKINPINTLGWDLNTPVNTWEGVTVENNRVTQLQINAKNLYTFEKSFQNLTELEYLHIGGNNLSNFPIEITKLTQLNFLHIGNNTISSIPSAFSNLNKLTQLQIQKNNIGYSGIETISKSFSGSFSYKDQGNISDDSTIFYNQNIIIYVPDSATNNQYQWYKDNSILNNENNRNLSVSEDGTYHCIITNPDYPSQNNITTGKYTMINAGPFLNDSTAIANIYLQNLNNSLSWDLNTPISTWEGVTHSGNPLERITGLVINNKNITILPTSINQLDALEVLQIQENNLTFEEIEKITQTPPASFNYSPQNKIGKSQIIEHSGNPIVISLPADINSSNNSYQWYKDGKVIENDANQNTYTTDQMGTFHCDINNITFPELTLTSEPTYILNSTIFEQDSLATVDIYNKNNNNTLQWDINAPITTWQGVQFSNGRINQLKINNAKLDTLPNSIGTLDALDTLWIQNNDLTFQSLENIATPFPQNLIYQPQNIIGEVAFIDATGGKNVLLEVPSDFDLATTNNHFQWYKDNEIIINANSRQYTTNTTGEYFCHITNDDFPLLTLQTATFNVFDTNQLKADSIIVASIYNDNPSNTLNWDLSTPIETWNGITVSFFRVKTIQLTNKNIQTLPNSIGELEKLDTLVLNENKIDILPESITDLTRLKLLNLSNNNLSSLLDQIGNLSFLNRLEIQNNLIENLPQSIQNLSNIEHINVSNNKLTFEDIILLPNDIQEYFYAPQDSIGENQSYEITREITLTVDQTIDMDVDNILYQWSKNGVIINEENTQNLIVTDKGRYNYIFKKESHSNLILTSKSIYVQFGEGTDPLDSLALADLNKINPINTLGWDLNTPVNTWEGVTVENNRVTQLQINAKNLYTFEKSFQNLTELEYLHIGGNNLSNFPIEITKFTQLNFLHIGNNTISSIPSAFSNLNKLTQLQIQKNNIGYSGIETISKSFSGSFSYKDQGNISDDSTIFYNQNIIISVPDSATNNQYQWYKDNSILNNENNRNLSVSEDGTYHCIITNPDYPSQNNITTGKYTMIDVSEFQADSLAILSLKSANPDVNLNWSTSLKVVNWDSVTHTGFQGDPVSAVKLKNIGLSTIPSDFMNDGALLNLDTFDISNNKLTFYDLYNAQAIINQEGAFIDYSEQAVVGEEQSIGFKEEMITLTLDPTLVDTRNQYQWYKDNIIIDGATDPTYTTNELGGYYCLVTNNDFSSLTLQSASTFIYSVDDFISDSTIVASIYTNNPNNTLNWDILSPINTWEGVKLRGERGRVKALILNAKQLDLLPENLGELTELELLEVGNNRINELPNSIGMLKVLKEFKINSNQLNDLVNELYDLEQLEVIDISNNQISSIDPKISQLSQLQQAHIQDNYFTFDDIQQIPLERNRFTYSPQQIIGEEQQIASAGAITIQIDPSIDPDVNTNQYTWLYNGVLIPGEKERTLVVDRNYGEYQCIINNTEYTDLTLTVASIFVETDEIDENDKLILEAIKALNTENTLDWPDDEPVAFWEGVRVDGITAKVIELDLWNKNLDVLPDNFAALNALKNVNLSSNNLSELPENIGDLAITLAYFNASQNHFSFAELDKIRLSDTNDKINFVYTNQKLIGVEGEIVTLENGYNTIYIPSFIQTENDVYQWYYQGKPLADATNNSVIVNTTGDYNYTITNSNYDNIVLTSFPIKVDGVTNIEGPINNKISIYPNPTENIATVQTTENIKILDVQIYDVTGKKYKIETNVRSITQWTLDLTKVPNGMYLINVQTDQGITLLKITKQ